MLLSEKLVLSKDNYKEYLSKVYASWLGKLIGIRLGAPVEGRDYQKIRDTYNFSHGYLLDYGIFAADDDSNGPLFLVKALDEKNNITAKDLGDTYLNYLQEFSGFFWWGGVGVSSENTAYANLYNGIEAPLSGSKEKNGIAIAEQIGGQIFSDCWGYVSGYDPDLAKDLAIKASSVTHDENGIQGGIFVAVAICLAMQMNDIHEVLDKTLEYLNPDMEYYKVCKDIISFHRENKGDFEDCHKYILDNYGYDKYPGVCHIIPNSAIMIMAMEYGDNDFDKTLESLNNCGWDTDCTCGNVGSIMGALVGLENINESWIKPINDIVNASSCIGCMNIQTVSESAKYFTKLAYKLKGIEINNDEQFDLPYATLGFFKDGNKSYKYSYYLKEDVYDARYTPEYSPTVYSGDEIRFTIQAKGNVKIFVEDCNKNIYESDNYLIDGTEEISFTVPVKENLIVNKYGIDADCEYEIKHVSIDHHSNVMINFASLPVDTYPDQYEKKGKNNIRSFNKLRGSYNHIEGMGYEYNNGLLSTGHIDGYYSEINVNLLDKCGSGSYLVFNMTGARHYYKFGVKNDTAILIKMDKIEEVIKEKYINLDAKELKLSAVCKDNKTSFYINDELIFDEDIKPLNSLFGISCDNNKVLLRSLEVK